MNAEKGPAIQVTGGTHEGKKGWLNASANATPKQIAVILVDSNGHEFATRISKTNYDFVDPNAKPPASYEEAALEQHPKMKKKMDALCRELARLDIQSPDNMIDIFASTLNRKITEQVEMGEDAMWKGVDYNADE